MKQNKKKRVLISTGPYLDVWFEVLPGDGMCDALVDIVERLLEDSGGHILLLLVLIQHLQQHLHRPTQTWGGISALRPRQENQATWEPCVDKWTTDQTQHCQSQLWAITCCAATAYPLRKSSANSVYSLVVLPGLPYLDTRAQA